MILTRVQPRYYISALVMGWGRKYFLVFHLRIF